MKFVASSRNEWPVVLDSQSPPVDDHDGFSDGFGRFRKPLVTVLAIALVIAGALTFLFESASVVRGDSLTFQERAAVMTATDVGMNLFAGGDVAHLEEFVAADASILYPGGSASGPEGVVELSNVIAGSSDFRDFTLNFDRLEEDAVVMTWVLEGPIVPGQLIWYSVPEGSAIAGEIDIVVRDGEVVELTVEVLS